MGRAGGPAGDWRGGRCFDADGLYALAAAHAAAFAAAAPFPHVVLDDVLPAELVQEVAEQFPDPRHPGWQRHDDRTQRKLQWVEPARMPEAAAALVGMLQSAPFVTFLERLTGIRGLVADPYCFQSGMHQVEPGGYLKVHVDQVLQPRLAMHRRINAIVYVDRDWDEAWGGELELWDEPVTTCVRRIVPRFNRLVLFATGPAARHGHPDPLRSPPGVTRRSVAVYYYTSPANPSTVVTDGGSRPAYRARPAEDLSSTGPRWRAVGRTAGELVPPVVLRGARGVRRRLRR